MTRWDRGQELRARQAVRDADAAELALTVLGLQILIASVWVGLAVESVWVTGGALLCIGVAAVTLTGRRIIAGLFCVAWVISTVGLGHRLYFMEHQQSLEGVLVIAGIVLCLWLIYVNIIVSTRRLEEDLQE